MNFQPMKKGHFRTTGVYFEKGSMGVCIFRRKADNDSDGKRTRIPDESGQPFRSKADNFVRLFTEFGMS
jgi:hypothetical protein